MSGSLESGRRLRPRPAAVNATVDAEQSTANEGVQDNVRRTRAAAKRAAMDESAKPAGVPSHSKKRAVQPAKKRPALTNISSQSNVATAAPSRVSKESAKPAPVFATADENAAPDRPDVAAQVKAEKVPSDSALQASSAAISSLNRRTMQNLYISAEEADQARSGTMPQLLSLSLTCRFGDVFAAECEGLGLPMRCCTFSMEELEIFLLQNNLSPHRSNLLWGIWWKAPTGCTRYVSIWEVFSSHVGCGWLQIGLQRIQPLQRRQDGRTSWASKILIMTTLTRKCAALTPQTSMSTCEWQRFDSDVSWRFQKMGFCAYLQLISALACGDWVMSSRL